MRNENDDLNPDEALRSALERLSVPVFIVDHSNRLRPMNRRGRAIFEAEAIREDLLEARPSHPLSAMIREVSTLTTKELTDPLLVTFPSGHRYTVEASRPSTKGRGRWTMLIMEPAPSARPDDETLLDQWQLTPRERELAKLLMDGLSNREIADTLGVTAETVKTHMGRLLEKTSSRSRFDFLSKLLRLR